jgi:hypothetical protein
VYSLISENFGTSDLSFINSLLCVCVCVFTVAFNIVYGIFLGFKIYKMS